MKKNISINISGIIFHIEEDGYETLKNYLDSINRYFSSYEDSVEILADIESRIAELLLAKLNEGKQVITAADVESLMTTMGSVRDFQAAEERTFNEEDQEPASDKGASQSTSAPQGLHRDTKRKTIAGVCAGIANYMKIDPVWIRLAFLVLTLVYGITIVAYIILWFILPESSDLPEHKSAKKMFRDPDRKVLAGVCAGFAAYFNVEVIVVRLIFILLVFAGGAGVIAYVVLWMILPQAQTLTEKMQMQGEPVTLSNIESSIKKSVNTPDNEESVLVKILLLPFRVLAAIVEALGKLLVPLVEIIRIGIGILITGVGMSLIFSTVVLVGVFLGLFSTTINLPFHPAAFPINEVAKLITPLSGISAFLVLVIPALMLLLLGISIIAKRIVFSSTVGWTLFALFFVSVAAVGFNATRLAYQFKESGRYEVEKDFDPGNAIAVLRINETGLDDYDATALHIEGYEGSTFKLVQSFSAQGPTRAEAIEYAKMVSHDVTIQDSVLIFDSNIRFNEGAAFRAQELRMTLYVPENHPFIIEHELKPILSQWDFRKNTGEKWEFQDQQAFCLTCPKVERDPFNVRNFEELRLSGLFDVTIKKGQEYRVKLTGPESEKGKYSIRQEGDILFVDYDADADDFWTGKAFNLDAVNLEITMPDLESLKVRGAGNVVFSGFNDDYMKVDAMGALRIIGTNNTKDLVVNLSGASELILHGRGMNLNATVDGASSMHAYDYQVENAVVHVNGASRASVKVIKTLEIEEGPASHVDYEGTPAIVRKN